MKDRIRFFKSYMRYLLEVLRFLKVRIAGAPWILSRTACLGNDVFKKLPLPYERFNVQKGRADYVVKASADASFVCKPSLVYKYLNLNDILTFLFQQKNIRLLKSRSKPRFIYMDSYSELTDQLFIHKTQRFGFCVNYSDLKVKEAGVWSEYECEGLIPITDLKKHYEAFFSFLRKTYADVPLIFIQFPTKLDGREKFKERGRAILNVIREIGHNYAPFYEFEADESIIDFHKDDNFPYHFNEETYDNLAEKIIRSGCLK
jgi:hypothetical protein